MIFTDTLNEETPNTVAEKKFTDLSPLTSGSMFILSDQTTCIDFLLKCMDIPFFVPSLTMITSTNCSMQVLSSRYLSKDIVRTFYNVYMQSDSDQKLF